MVDTEKVLVSKKIYSGEKNYKYFIGYLYNDNKVNPIHTMISKTKAYVKSYYGKLNGCIFLTEDDELLQRYNTIWDRLVLV